uniref:ATP synthase F0 subunit 8 n=1 Tax=Synanthedon bicingulata TaxID=3138307 RepID=UPI00315CE8E1
MPQMMPLNWIFSLFIYIIIFIIFNIMNYYIFTMKLTPNKNIFSMKNNFYWKW